MQSAIFTAWASLSTKWWF